MEKATLNHHIISSKTLWQFTDIKERKLRRVMIVYVLMGDDIKKKYPNELVAHRINWFCFRSCKIIYVSVCGMIYDLEVSKYEQTNLYIKILYTFSLCIQNAFCLRHICTQRLLYICCRYTISYAYTLHIHTSNLLSHNVLNRKHGHSHSLIKQEWSLFIFPLSFLPSLFSFTHRL